MNDYAPVFFLFLVSIVWIFSLSTTDNQAREKLIQELCSKQKYDFCEVDKTIYKLKE